MGQGFIISNMSYRWEHPCPNIAKYIPCFKLLILFFHLTIISCSIQDRPFLLDHCGPFNVALLKAKHHRLTCTHNWGGNAIKNQIVGGQSIHMSFRASHLIASTNLHNTSSQAESVGSGTAAFLPPPEKSSFDHRADGLPNSWISWH